MTDALAGKKVVIVGLARQGTALARFLVGVGAEVIVTDRRAGDALAEELHELEGLPIEYVLGGHPESLLDGVDVLALSGGVAVDVPIAVEAQRRGIVLTNDAQIFLERCPAAVIGITGSAGKTTTTALVGAICRAEGSVHTWVGGNIGNPLISDLADIQPDDHVVMELSSFQLEIMTAGTQVAALLNLTPNHLDRHKTMAVYIAAKTNLLRNQAADGIAVLGADDEVARAQAGQVRGRVLWFSGRDEVQAGAWLDDEHLCLRSTEGSEHVICKVTDIQLRGHHNVLNALAACAIADAAGVSVQAMQQGIAGFEGVVHRLEVVAERDGVTYVNDSIATAPERVIAALESFDQKEPLVLLLGGRDKDLPWRDLMDKVVVRCRAVIAFGEAREMIAREAYLACRALHELEWPVLEQRPDLEQAVLLAATMAQPGMVVLLSPGCTSYDAYVDFAERGEHFRVLVSGL